MTRTPAEVAAVAISDPSIRDMLADIYTWMCEPDVVEEPTLEWVKDWVNRRPIADLAMVAMLMSTRPQDGGGA